MANIFIILRNILFFITLLSYTSFSFAQNLVEKKPTKSPMEELSFLIGNWAGEGISYAVDGSKLLYYDTEFVRYDLNGALLLINARGYRDGKTTYQLHTVIHYDMESKHYIYSPYSANGTRPFTCNLKNKQFICYTMQKNFRLIFQRLPNGVWNEYGERKTETGWRKTFETKLSAV